MSVETTPHRLRAFFNPRSIALVGASPDRGTIRGRIVSALVESGFKGQLYPISRSHEQIFELNCYKTVESLPVAPDLAVITVPAEVVAQLLEECGRKGIRTVLILSSGFGEQSDAIGRDRETQLREISARYSMVVCGPNSEGFYNAADGVKATFSPAMEDGSVSTYRACDNANVAIVSQSGGIGFAVYDRGRRNGLPVSYVVSMGNELGLTSTEILDYLIDDPHTGVLTMFAEGFTNPTQFWETAQKARARGKPIIAAKMGRSSAAARAAMSHTATLSGSHAVHEGVFRHLGVTSVDDLEQLITVSHAFARFRGRPAHGTRVGVLTASGGAGIWVADTCADYGLQVVELDERTRESLTAMMPAYGSAMNPVDITAQGVFTFGYSGPLEVMLDSPAIDMVIVVCSAIRPDVIERDSEALAAVNAASSKPVMFCPYTTVHPEAAKHLTQSGYPLTNQMRDACRALAAWADYCRVVGEPAPALRVEPQDTAVHDALRHAPTILCEHLARQVLALSGLDMGRAILAKTEDEAAEAFASCDTPVAVKVQSGDITHKSDMGGVELHVRKEDEVRAAFRSVLSKAKTGAPDAIVDGVLIQPMAAPGVEMILGISTDPEFGPMLMVGLGGIWVDLQADVALSPVPISATQAQVLLDTLGGRDILDGARGQPAVDVDALLDLMVQLSHFAYAHRTDVAEIDLNPVIVHANGQGLTVADALIVKHAETSGTTT